MPRPVLVRRGLTPATLRRRSGVPGIGVLALEPARVRGLAHDRGGGHHAGHRPQRRRELPGQHDDLLVQRGDIGGDDGDPGGQIGGEPGDQPVQPVQPGGRRYGLLD